VLGSRPVVPGPLAADLHDLVGDGAQVVPGARPALPEADPTPVVRLHVHHPVGGPGDPSLVAVRRAFHVPLLARLPRGAAMPSGRQGSAEPPVRTASRASWWASGPPELAPHGGERVTIRDHACAWSLTKDHTARAIRG